MNGYKLGAQSLGYRAALRITDSKVAVETPHFSDRSDRGRRTAGECFAKVTRRCVGPPLIDRIAFLPDDHSFFTSQVH